MIRSVRRHVMSGAVAGALASVLISTSVYAAAPSWLKPLDLRVRDGVRLADTAFSGQGIAVTWNEVDEGMTSVGIRTSNNAGQSFLPTTLIPKAFGAAVEICGSEVNLVYARHAAHGRWVIERASRDIAGGEFQVGPVASGPGIRVNPDVACANGRVFVSWREQVQGDTMRLYVANALISDGVFGAPADLGLTDRYYPTGLALAGSGDTAYAAFVRTDGKLRVKRWSIGPAPGYGVTAKATQIVGPGTERNPTHIPVIDADGDTVAVSWQKCSGTLARLSHDRGATWDPVRRIAFFGCDVIVEGGTAPDSISIHGPRIALTYRAGFIPNFERTYLVRTHTAFDSFSRDVLGDHQTHMVGYVTVEGQLKLADAYDTFQRVRFRRQI